MIFEWDDDKNNLNIERHGISFEYETLIFNDKNRISGYDDRENYYEIREVSIGMVNNEIILTVIHTDRDNKMRIISARKANKRERKEYYEQNNIY